MHIAYLLVGQMTLFNSDQLVIRQPQPGTKLSKSRQPRTGEKGTRASMHYQCMSGSQDRVIGSPGGIYIYYGKYGCASLWAMA